MIKGVDIIKVRLTAFLNRYGVLFMFPGITPFGFVTTLIISGILLSAVCLQVNLYLALAAFPIGIYFPVIVIRMSNSSDNNEMLTDIESIYDILRIQARAGVHIQDSLMDCYMLTVNKRLKAALLILCNRISTKSTLEEAVREFNGKFANSHIDVLCIVLNQAQSSGKMVQILADMSEQIRQVRHAHSLKEKGRLERRIEIIELLMFLGVIAIGVYSMGSEIVRLLNN